MSWQIRLTRIFLRIFAKTTLRFAGVAFLRRVFSLIDRRAESRWPGSSMAQAFRVCPTDYGEILEPRNSNAAKTILYLPGGAFLVRAPHVHRHLAALIAADCNAAAAIVHYRLAPEHPFPAALEDALAAYRELLDHGVAANNIVFMGDSAGGGLALSAALALRDRGEQLPSAVVVMSPLADLTFKGASRSRNANKDPMLPVTRNDADARYYSGRADPADPMVSAVYGDYAHYPPVLSLVGSDEILLDDTTRIAEKAHRAGIRMDVFVGEGMPHVWPLFWYSPEAREGIRRIALFVAETGQQEFA